MRGNRIPAAVVRSGASSQRLTAQVLAFYGHECWLKLPGCKIKATTKDHVRPVNHGGTDAIENLRPACGSCNSKRRDLAISGVGGIIVTVLVGPVPSLTTQRALASAAPGDAVIAHTLIRSALGTGSDAPHLDRLAARAWRTAMDQALRAPGRFSVWLAHPVPTARQLQQYARLRYNIEVVDPGRTEANTQAGEDREARREVTRWYNLYPEGAVSIERVKAHTPTGPHTRGTPEPAGSAEPSRHW